MRKGRKQFFLLSVLAALLALSGCAVIAPLPAATPDPTAYAPVKIRVTAGDLVLYGQTNTSRTAHDFAGLLPLSLRVTDYYSFVKAIDLPQRLFDSAQRTRAYRIGGFSYWPEGSAVAFFYDDELEQTVVEVIPLGQLEDGVEGLADFAGELLVERVDDVSEMELPNEDLEGEHP